MSIPILAGRDFDSNDRVRKPQPVVVSREFAREFFGNCLTEILLDSPCPVLSVRQCD